MTDADADGKPAYLHGRLRGVTEGDRVRVNDRSRPLVVTGHHTKPNNSPSATGPYYVIELEGNGTEYHLLCWERANHGPMLYKRSAWEETENGYEYPRAGERVNSANIKAGTNQGPESEK